MLYRGWYRSRLAKSDFKDALAGHAAYKLRTGEDNRHYGLNQNLQDFRIHRMPVKI